MNPQLLQRIERMTLAVGLVIFVLFAALRGFGSAASVAVGCAIGLMNFFLLRILVLRMINNARTEGAGAAGGSVVLFGLKLIVLALVVFAVIQLERIDALALAAGFLSFLVAIVLASVLPSAGTVSQPNNAPGSRVD